MVTMFYINDNLYIKHYIYLIGEMTDKIVIL